MEVTAANAHTTTFAYDAENRLVRMIFHDGTFTFISYDALGRKTSETDQAGKTIYYGYNAEGQLTSVIDASGYVTHYEYDAIGNKIAEADANGNTTRYKYDKMDRLVETELPLGQKETYSYNSLGQLVAKTDFNGQTSTFAYDSDGRLTTKTYLDTNAVVYAYTTIGQIASIVDSSGIIDYDYDILNRTARISRYDAANNLLNELTYNYDWNGNRTSLSVNNGTLIETTTYAFDGLNRLASVTDPDGNFTTYSYDNIGNRESIIYPNNTQVSYVYDTLNRLTYLENKDLTTSSIISSYTYELGPTGNRLAVIEHTGRRVDYGYDQLYRLIEEKIREDGVTVTDTIGYTYDPVGNRLSKTDNSGAISYTYDPNDRMLTAGGTHFTYDANGNALTKTDGNGTVHYGYDYENRLITVNDPISGLTTYIYDPNSDRVGKTDTVGATRYLVDTNQLYAQVLEETLPNGSLVTYTCGDDLISQTRASTTSYYHSDGNLSTRQLTDSSGQITDTYTYDAFGNLIASSGSTINNYLYTGEQYDPNCGFYYLRARYYAPETGRFDLLPPISTTPSDRIL